MKKQFDHITISRESFNVLQKELRKLILDYKIKVLQLDRESLNNYPDEFAYLAFETEAMVYEKVIKDLEIYLENLENFIGDTFLVF